MKVLIVGGTGLIGRAIAAKLAPRHEVIAVGRRRGSLQVDLNDPESIARLYQGIGRIDAVVCAAGQPAFRPLPQITADDWQSAVREKLLGQVHLVRLGIDAVRDHGSFTLTSGTLSHHPSPGSAAASLVNAGVEGFVRAAALDLPRGLRINVVSPPWVSETLSALGRDPSGGVPVDELAETYLLSVEGPHNGVVLTTNAGT